MMTSLVHLFPTGAGPDLQQGIALLLEAKDAYAANPNVKFLQCNRSMQPKYPLPPLLQSVYLTTQPCLILTGYRREKLLGPAQQGSQDATRQPILGSRLGGRGGRITGQEGLSQARA